MKSVFELASRYVYPAVRRRLVEILYDDHRFSQEEIAHVLGISQSAASRYISMDRGGMLKISKYRDVNEELKELGKRISLNMLDRYKILLELTKISLKLLGKGYLCSFHKKIDDVDPSRCNICPTLFSQFAD